MLQCAIKHFIPKGVELKEALEIKLLQLLFSKLCINGPSAPKEQNTKSICFLFKTLYINASMLKIF